MSDGKKIWCDAIERYKYLILRYIERAGACDTNDVERLAEVTKEQYEDSDELDYNKALLDMADMLTSSHMTVSEIVDNLKK